MAYTNNLQKEGVIDIDGFWSRFHAYLARKMYEEKSPTKKGFFRSHGIPYSSYDNSFRLKRLPASEALYRYSITFGVSIDFLVFGKDATSLSNAQRFVGENSDVEEIVLLLKVHPELIPFVKGGLLSNNGVGTTSGDVEAV